MVADTQQSSAHAAHFNSAVYTGECPRDFAGQVEPTEFPQQLVRLAGVGV